MKVGLNEFLDMKKRFEEFYNKNKREPRYVTTKNGYKVMLPVFKDMLRRYEDFVRINGREPNYISIQPQPNGKIEIKKFRDMLRRYEDFVKNEGHEPNIIYLEQGKSDHVSLGTFKDMLRRYEDFVRINGREPKVIYVKGTSKDTGWVTTGYYKQDYQDTDHTCGPSSLQMALSALGCNATEQELSKAAGTLSSGTSHDGMRKAVAYAAKKCKKNLSLQFKYFRDIGWDGVIKHIKAGGEVVIHVVTRPGLDTDVNGRIIWKGAFGHYVYLVGVNKAKGQVRIADPTKGVVTFPVKGVEQAMRNWPGESLLLISVKK